MSAAESEKSPAADRPPDLVESDAHETWMIYGDGSGVPWLLVLIWICALTGLAIYGATQYFPDLKAWGRP